MEKCNECNINIEKKVLQYSVNNLGFALCRQCQGWFKDVVKFTTTTDESLNLYFALKKRGVPAEIEKFDGNKTIDIAVTFAKVNIEVDGQHHNFNPRQALADLKRTFYAFKKGYLTLRIPNALVRHHLNETADYITDFLNVSVYRNGKY